MPTAIITGSGGLIGSEAVRHFVSEGFYVCGIDNDMRSVFFGPSASTKARTEHLISTHSEFRTFDVDIRDAEGVSRIFAMHGREIELIVHAAAQPSHDWAASDPLTDFGINALGTLNLLEAARAYAPDATFAYLSTNKVYGTQPNSLPLYETETRLELPADHAYYAGIDTTMSIDHTLHSLFGVSKLSGDLMVQEYGRYFSMPTVCFRAGCLTGPGHAGAELHGFLSYLVRCTVTGQPYTVLGYGGKQVRDNIHSSDVISAIAAFHSAPRCAAVYNIGGGRGNSCSVVEAIALSQQIAGRDLTWKVSSSARIGDHRWWISDVSEFERDYPGWRQAYTLRRTVREIFELNADKWQHERQTASSQED